MERVCIAHEEQSSTRDKTALGTAWNFATASTATPEESTKNGDDKLMTIRYGHIRWQESRDNRPGDFLSGGRESGSFSKGGADTHAMTEYWGQIAVSLGLGCTRRLRDGRDAWYMEGLGRPRHKAEICLADALQIRLRLIYVSDDMCQGSKRSHVQGR